MEKFCLNIYDCLVTSHTFLCCEQPVSDNRNFTFLLWECCQTFVQHVFRLLTCHQWVVSTNSVKWQLKNDVFYVYLSIFESVIISNLWDNSFCFTLHYDGHFKCKARASCHDLEGLGTWPWGTPPLAQLDMGISEPRKIQVSIKDGWIVTMNMKFVWI